MRFLSILVTFALIVGASPLLAQKDDPLGESVDAVFRAVKTTPLVGEPVVLELFVTLPPGYELAEWPEVAGKRDEMEITDPEERETIAENAATTIIQKFTLRIWKPDDFSTPEVFIGYHIAGEDEIKRIPVRPVYFSVPTVLDRNDLNLRPALPPVSFLYIPAWLMAIIAITSVGGLRVGWRWWLRSRLEAQRAELVLSPAQEAERQLANIPDTQEPAQTLAAVNRAIRSYLDSQFGLETQPLTTAEMRANLELRARLAEDHLRSLFKLMGQMELTRFTATQIDSETTDRYVQQARRWIAAVDLWTKREAES